MPNYKNNTTQTLTVKTKDGKMDSIKAGETKSLVLAETPANAGLLHAGGLQESKASVPGSKAKPEVTNQIKPAQ